MHTSRVKVLPRILIVGGRTAELTIDDDSLTIASATGGRLLVIRADEVKRASFNGNNGLWVITPKDGDRIRFQSSGWLISADRSPAGKQANVLLRNMLRSHGVRVFGL